MSLVQVALGWLLEGVDKCSKNSLKVRAWKMLLTWSAASVQPNPKATYRTYTNWKLMVLKLRRAHQGGVRVLFEPAELRKNCPLWMSYQMPRSLVNAWHLSAAVDRRG